MILMEGRVPEAKGQGWHCRTIAWMMFILKSLWPWQRNEWKNEEKKSLFSLERKMTFIFPISYKMSSWLDGLQVQHCGGIHCCGWEREPHGDGSPCLLEQKQDKESGQSNGLELYFTGSIAVQVDERKIKEGKGMDCVRRLHLAHELVKWKSS